MLHAAAKNGNIESIELLMSQGFDIDSRDREDITPLNMQLGLVVSMRFICGDD